MFQVISKWYGIRNSPGTQDLCPKIEWSMFSSLMFSLLGYEHLILSDNKKNDNNSTEVVKKKLRTSSDGSLEDWEYILNSNHHSLIGNQIQAMLNLSKSSIKPKDVPQETSDTKFNINALLFPYLLQIFYAFHLLYEETKMNVLTTKDLEPLGKMLYDISLELGLDAFVSHYWKDFPRTCILTFSSNIVKLSETEMKKIIQPSYFTTEPPSIFKHLDQVLKKSDNITQYPYLNNVNNTCRDIIEVNI